VLTGVAFAAFLYTSLFGPIVLLALLWKRLSSWRKERAAFTIAILVSLSYGYLMLGLLFKSALLGSDYRNRLFATLQTNTALAFCLFLLAVLRKSSSRLLLASAAFTTSLAWYLIWVVNAAV
jgi:hypothetical protein